MYAVGGAEKDMKAVEDEEGKWCDPDFPATVASIGNLKLKKTGRPHVTRMHAVVTSPHLKLKKTGRPHVTCMHAVVT